MGPLNVALVKLFLADQELREAQGRLEAASRNVRIQQRRVSDLAELIRTTRTELMEQQAHQGNLELDLKTRDAHIERLRTQQQQSRTNKEYQAFLLEINLAKVDRGKVEDETIKLLEAVETLQAEHKAHQAQLEAEKAKLQTMESQIQDRLKELQANIDQLRPRREQAAEAVAPRAIAAFDRLNEHYEGEAMAAIARPDRRREEYICTGCHMSLMTDVYNRLHSRDDMVACPSCRRLLYIPEDLTPDQAVNKPRERREPRGKDVGAAVGRQSSAADVLRSLTPEPTEAPVDTPSPADPAT
jgi:hypothetical protein